MKFLEMAGAMARLAGIADLTTVIDDSDVRCDRAVFDIRGCVVEILDFRRGQAQLLRASFDPPPELSTNKLAELMKFNFVHFAIGGGPCFGINPGTGQIVLLVEMQLRTLAPEAGLKLIRDMAAAGPAWLRGDLALATISKWAEMMCDPL